MPIFLMSTLADICDGTKTGLLDLLLEYSQTYRHLLNGNFRNLFDWVRTCSLLSGCTVDTSAVRLHNIDLLLPCVQDSDAHVLIVFVSLLFYLSHCVPQVSTRGSVKSSSGSTGQIHAHIQVGIVGRCIAPLRYIISLQSFYRVISEVLPLDVYHGVLLLVLYISSWNIMMHVAFDGLIYSGADFKTVWDIPHVRMAQFPRHTVLIQVLLEVGIVRSLFICFLLLVDQVIVSFDLLPELCVGNFELINAHVVLLYLKFDLFQLINRQITLFLDILMHISFV